MEVQLNLLVGIKSRVELPGLRPVRIQKSKRWSILYP